MIDSIHGTLADIAGEPGEPFADVITSLGARHVSPARVGHAVVVGGGMAGLLAVRVLTNHFERVTLVERDALTDSAQARKGVPQGRMLHVLLPRGRGIMERLFPGYGHGLKAAGAVELRVPTDALILTPAGWLDRRATGWSLLSASRPLFEWAVRQRPRELPGVTILDRHDVPSLLVSRDGRQVTGVTVRPLDHAGSTRQQLGPTSSSTPAAAGPVPRSGSQTPATPRPPRRTSTRTSATPPESIASRPVSARTGRW